MNEEKRLCLELAKCYEFMPGSEAPHTQKEVPRLFLKHPITESVTFFGGTFDPFHQGHRACLDLCPEKNILIVPDRNPYKKLRDNTDVYQEFVKLAELLKETPYSLYPGFLALSETNPTSSWLPFVKIKEKNFLMGDDSFMGLLKWIRPEVVVRSLHKLYVVPRTFNKENYKLVEAKLLELNPNLKIIYLSEHPFQDISSTKLRA